MAKTLEQKAQRLVRTTHRIVPKMLKHTAALVDSGDRITHIDNRDFDLDEREKRTARKDLERGWVLSRFAGTVVLHLPGLTLATGRLALAANAFEKALQATMPDTFHEIETGQGDYYTAAANLLGLDGDAALEKILAAIE